MIEPALSILAFSWVAVGNIALVALGLGAVIFVHELGHFVVAKMCGVKCEKFYIGFDVPLKFGPIKFPSALWKKQWGETEYGIGILPLGGYVKMLGQDDNPAKLSEEMKRAEMEAEGAAETKEITGPDGEKYHVHPRSYLAKSVPQRMAIISAGVIMNVIFAFIFAVVAFGIGVPYLPCIVSGTSPGSPAWVANIQVGDEIVRIGERKNPSFTDLRGSVTLADKEDGVPLEIVAPGESAPRLVTLNPKQGTGLATIGITSPSSLRLFNEAPVIPYFPAGDAQRVGGASDADAADDDPPGFHGGDEVVAVNGQPVTSWAEVDAILATHADQTLEFTVRRGGEAPKENRFATRTGGRELTFSVVPRRMRRLGLVMKMGKVAAVQTDSPAAKDANGVVEGDFIQQVNGEPIGDPITWPARVRQLAEQGDWISLTVTRTSDAGEDETVTIDDIKPRVPNWIETASTSGVPMPCAPLGVAYRILNRVDRVLPGSPAEEAGLRSGDAILSARVVLPSTVDADSFGDATKHPIAFSDDEQNWPYFMDLVQLLPPDTEIELSVKRRDEELQVTVRPTVLSGTSDVVEYYPNRGLRFEPLRRIQKANSFAEQIQMGYDKTIDSLLAVYRFLGKIGGQVPLRALGGPITIAKASYYSAFEGVGKLLVFLTLLSANLAVINFLPIPILDGGHMVLLAYEGIMRRPPREKFVVALHMIGFAFIISLMLFVFALDLEIIPRNL